MIAFFAKHPTASNLLMLIFLAMGILSIRSLRRETFPDFSPTEVEVRIPYLGATAEEVEEVVCQRVEDALDGVRYVKELRSDARQGLAIVTVEMEPSGDYQAFKDEIDTAIAAIDNLPPETEEPVVTHLHTTDPVLSILVSGELSPTDLKLYCENLKERLQRNPEISLIDIEGFSDHQLRVELMDSALRQHDLSAAEVAEIIRRQSVNLPGGVIQANDGELTIRFTEERRSPLQMQDLVVVASAEGGEIRLGDIAQVFDLFEFDEEQVLLGDRRAGLLNVRMTKNQDVIRVANSAKDFIEQERSRYPQVDFEITQDTSTIVQDRLTMLVKNAWQGMLLVFLTMWAFFNVRLSIWVVMSLPVSFLGAFFFMPHLGLTLNMITLVSLLLALGILMDDGIVIAENIATHRAKGKSAMASAVDGINEVKAGVFSSFLTTVCVLGPLAFLEGDIGAVLKVVPMVLILVLIVSLAEAFCILPAHLGHAMRHDDQTNRGRLRQAFERFIDWMRQRLIGRAVDLLLRWRYLWVGSVAGLFLVCIGVIAGGVLKFQAFPELDGDVIEARLVLAPGTPLERTQEVVDHVTACLNRVNDRLTPNQPDGQDLIETVYVRCNQNPDAFENGPHVATVTADLLTAEARNTQLDDLFQIWSEEVGQPPDVVSLTYTEPALGPQGRNIEIRLRGDDLHQLEAAAEEMRQWLAEFDGVLNLAIDLREGRPELHVRLREGAFGLGLDAENMARQLRAAFQGTIADEIQVGAESYEIDVRLRNADRDSLADFEYFHFTLSDGRRVPLGEVTEVETQRGWSRIARIDGMRTVTLRGDVDSRRTNTANLMTEIRKELLPELQEKYPDVAVSFEGEAKEGMTTRLSILRGMLIGLLGVFVLLSFQFHSYVEPLIVMVAIPLSLIGVVIGHLLMGLNLSMPSIMGFVSLAGIVVNDSILLVLFLKREREKGTDVLEAAGTASRQRFRAIALTSLTTIAGLLPLLAERSLQAQVLIPLATSIAFGLLASTVLVLLVIPSLYAILDDLGLVTDARETEAAQRQELA